MGRRLRGEHGAGGGRGGGRVLPRGRLQHAALRVRHVDPGQRAAQRGQAIPGLSIMIEIDIKRKF